MSSTKFYSEGFNPYAKTKQSYQNLSLDAKQMIEYLDTHPKERIESEALFARVSPLIDNPEAACLQLIQAGFLKVFNCRDKKTGEFIQSYTVLGDGPDLDENKKRDELMSRMARAFTCEKF